MPESFLAALRVVLPMALLIILGVGVRKAGIMDRTVMRNVDKLTFRVFMPVLLFKNIYETDLSQSFAPEEAVFAALSLVLVIFPTALLLPPRLVKSRAQAASIGQAMIRSNYILFGIAVAESIFGEGNVGPVALLGAIVVPLDQRAERHRPGDGPLRPGGAEAPGAVHSEKPHGGGGAGCDCGVGPAFPNAGAAVGCGEGCGWSNHYDQLHLFGRWLGLGAGPGKPPPAVFGARPADGFDSADIPAPLCGSGLPEPKPVRVDGPLRRPYRRGLLSHGGGYGSGRALGGPVGLCRNHTVDFYNVLLYLPLPLKNSYLENFSSASQKKPCLSPVE